MLNENTAVNIETHDTLPANNSTRTSVIKVLSPNTHINNVPTSELSVEEYLTAIQLEEGSEGQEVGYRSDAIAAKIREKYQLGMDFLPTVISPQLPESTKTIKSNEEVASEPASGIRKKRKNH